MQPVASPLTMTCATADPLTPALRALGPVRGRPFRCHSSRGPEFTAGILLWHAHTCQGNNKVARVSPTSAVRGGQGRSFGHLGKKSPLHLRGAGDGRRHAKPLGEVEAEAVEERSLGRVRVHDAAETELAAVLGGQDDVRALNAAELIEDRAGALPEARSP